jgi:hypothetical protein
MTHNPSTSNQFLGFDPSMEPNIEWSMDVGSWDFTDLGSHEEFVNFGGMDMESWDTYMSQSAELDCCVKTGGETEMVSSAKTQNEPMSFNTRNEIEAILSLDCHLCMHAFSCEKDRDRHFRSSHREERLFRCPKLDCEKSYKSKAHVNVHVRNSHDREKQYVCGQCNRGFFWRWERDRHVNVQHLKIKEFQCEVCGETFGHKSRLKYHVQSKAGCKG